MPYASISATPFSLSLREGLGHHGAGRLLAAAQCYRRAYSDHPEDSRLLLLLGIVARQTGQYTSAIGLIEAAIAKAPRNPASHLHLALAYRANGMMDAAEKHCLRALEIGPSFASVWCCLAELQAETGREDNARESWRRAEAFAPKSPRAGLSIGRSMRRLGRHEEAIAAYSAVLERSPDDATARYYLGAALDELGRFEEARGSYIRALGLRAAFPEALLRLGNLHFRAREYLAAAKQYRRALALRPSWVPGWCNLGNALRSIGRMSAAVECYGNALRLAPDHGAARRNLGNTLLDLRDFGAAEACFREGIRIDGSSSDLRNGLGNALFRSHQDAQAADCYRRAIAISPRCFAAETNLGNVLMRQGRTVEMMEHFECALAFAPESAGGHYNLALAYLSEGRYLEGWREHEWRWDFPELKLRRRFSQPQWAGEPLPGKTLLLHAEQGLGDTLQFVRYALLATGRAGKVVLQVQPRLARLLGSLPGIDEVVPIGARLPRFDAHCPLMSLPHVFATTLETVPAQVPYLRASETEMKSAWRKWPRGGLRVGLAWAGNPSHKSDSQRSISLSALLPLAEVQGVSWFSCQMGAAAEQMDALAARFPIADTSSMTADMAETAAMISTLDLVISVDTAIAHLAGALGRPVWLLLHRAADWRWMRERDDSPWYPTARLFRQRRAGEWQEPVERLREQLHALARSFSRN